jgi:hypothetical protein
MGGEITPNASCYAMTGWRLTKSGPPVETGQEDRNRFVSLT